MPAHLLAYALHHEGKYPGRLDELLPGELWPIPDTLKDRRAWETRDSWIWLLLGCFALIPLWMIACLVGSRRRWGYPVFVAAVSVLVGATAVFAVLVSTPPSESTYQYLDWFVIYPGLEEPVPSGVPILWTRRGYPFATKPNHWDTRPSRWYTRGKDWYPSWDYPENLAPWGDGRWGGPKDEQQEDEECPFDLEQVENLVRTPQLDQAALLAQAREGDINAYLVLALRREKGAADLFAELRHGPLHQRIALWGLYLLGDGRTEEVAERAVASPDLATTSYAGTIIGLVRDHEPLIPQQVRPIPWRTDLDGDIMRCGFQRLPAEGKRRLRATALAKLRGTPSPEERRFYVIALGCTGRPEDARVLIDRLNDSDVADEAATSLGQLRAIEAVNPLIDLLRGGRISLRRAAAHALRQIGDPRAIPALQEATSTGRQGGLEESLEALTAYQKYLAKHPQARRSELRDTE